MDRLVRNLHAGGKLYHHFYSALKVGISFMLALFICSTAIAQDINISGTVTSVQGESLPGVTIMIQGTDRGTTTDLDGNYS